MYLNAILAIVIVVLVISLTRHAKRMAEKGDRFLALCMFGVALACVLAGFIATRF